MTRRLVFVVAVTFAVNAVLKAHAGDNKHLILLKSEIIDTSSTPKKTVLSSSILSEEEIIIIIQFKDLIRADQREKLKKIGVKFLHYIPNNAYIVGVSEKAVPLLNNLEFIQWMGDYEPAFKIDPELMTTEAVNEKQRVKINIRLFEGKESRSLKHFIVKRLGGILYYKKAFVKAELAREYIAELAERDEVAWIEEAKEPTFIQLELNGNASAPRGKVEELSGFETGVKILKASYLYEKGLTGEGQIVAVGDTGLDIGEISNRLSLDFQNSILAGHALGYFNESWADEMGHGTHVAGSILGSGANAGGVLSGVAFGAKLIVQNFSGIFGGVNISPDVSDFLEPVYQDGARVHSDSWGFPGRGKYDQFSKSFDEFIWQHPDMVVVLAAGNEGKDEDKDGVIDPKSLLSPATAKNCITVGASENYVLKGGVQKKWGELKKAQNWSAEPIASDPLSDNENGIAAFSSRGPTADGRLKPDLVAPGTNILSARSHHPKASKMWGVFDDHYVWSGGSSMSTPLVSGAATLVRQFYQGVSGLHRVSAALVKATLIAGADDLYPGQFGFGDVVEISKPRPNIHEGWGRVNLEKSLFSEHRTIRFADEEEGIKMDEIKIYEMSVLENTEPLAVVLVYTDYPGAIQARSALVNDLDLEVISPSGKKIFPNGSSRPDRLNNVETVDLKTPERGVYKIRVIGYHLPQGTSLQTQPYAIVIAGGLE